MVRPTSFFSTDRVDAAHSAVKSYDSCRRRCGISWEFKGVVGKCIAIGGGTVNAEEQSEDLALLLHEF